MIRATIKYLPGQDFALYVNNNPEYLFFSYEERVSCLRKALAKFDQDITEVAQIFRNHFYGAYTWCYTPQFIRGENITGVLKIRFIIELTILLRSKTNDLVVTIDSFFPRHFRTELENSNIVLKSNHLNILQSYIRKAIAGLYRSLQIIIKNTAHIFSKSNNSYKGILLDVNKSPENNRLDEIANFNAKDTVFKYYSGQEHTITGFPNDDIVIFRKELNMLDGLKAMIKTFAIGLFILRNKKKLSSLWAYLPSLFSFKLFDLISYGLSIDKYFHKSTITHLIHVSTLTKPTYRLLWSLAKKNKISVTLVSSRSLKILSPSERIYACDVEGFNDTTLPDWYIFRDNFSKRVFDNYPNLRNNTFIGSRFIDKILPTDQPNGEKAILILFTHLKDVCQRIIIEIKNLELHPTFVPNIIFRSHPALRITINEMKKQFPDFNLIDISGKDYALIKEYRVMAISGPTTAALEFIKTGGLLLWLPYVWSDGILFDDFMDTIGVKCVNMLDFKQNFFRYLNDDNSWSKLLTESLKIIEREFYAGNKISEVFFKNIYNYEQE